MRKSEEYVLTYPRFSLPEGLPVYGFLPDRELFYRLHLDGWEMWPRRSLVEENAHCKHVAAYMLIWSVSEGCRYYLAYQRGPKGEGEDRLEGLFSLGVGGHVNSEDGNIREAADRELREELPEAAKAWRYADRKILGVINDDYSDVGSVHLGAFLSVQLGPTALSMGEGLFGGSPLRNPRWVTAQEIKDELDGKMEAWSQIVYHEVIRPGLAIS